MSPQSNEKVRSVAESSLMLLATRFVTIAGIPVMLAFLYFISSTVVDLKVQMGQMQTNMGNTQTNYVAIVNRQDKFDTRLSAVEKTSDGTKVLLDAHIRETGRRTN